MAQWRIDLVEEFIELKLITMINDYDDHNCDDDHNIFGSDPDLLIWRKSVTDGIIASDQRD